MWTPILSEVFFSVETRKDSNNLQSYYSSLSSSYESNKEIVLVKSDDTRPYLCFSLTGDIDASTDDPIQRGPDMQAITNKHKLVKSSHDRCVLIFACLRIFAADHCRPRS